MGIMLALEELLFAINELDSIVVVSDKFGNIRYVNDAFEEKYGYTKEEAIGQNPRILKTNYHDDQFYKNLWDTILNGETWEGIFRNKSKSGKLIWENARISPIIKNGKLDGFIAVKEDITYKKELEEQFHKEKFLLDELFDNSPVGIILLRPIYQNEIIDDLIVIKANPIAAGIFERLGIVGISIKKFLSNYQEIILNAKIMLTSKHSFEHTCSNINKYLKIRTFPVGENSFCMVISDVTEYRNNIIALEESEQRYSSLVEDSPALIRRFNKDGIISYVNNYYADYYNKKSEHFIGTNLYSLLTLEEQDIFKENLKKLSPQNPIIEYQQKIKLQDGSVKWQKWVDRALIDSMGNIAEYQSVGMDFTRLKITETQLEQQNTKLNTIFDNSLMGIGVINSKGYFILANSKLKEMFEYDESISTEVNYFDHVFDEDKPEIKKSFINLFNGKVKNFNVQRRYLKNNGSEFWADLFAAPISYQNGKPTEVLGMIIDISKRHKMEVELKESEQKLKRLNNTKDKLFSVIAHDIKNPFNAILGFSSILDRNLQNFSESEVKEFISKILEASEQTYKLLEDLLTWAKSQLGQLKVKKVLISPSEIIQECNESLKSLANNKNITIKTRFSYFDLVEADMEMLKFVIRNLLHNALKFSHPNSVIECNVEENENNQVQISIKDFGVGIRPEKLRVLFNLDEFLSTSGTSLEKGTGLGLSLSKEMIELNQGDIIVDSVVSKGSTFTIVLPKK